MKTFNQILKGVMFLLMTTPLLAFGNDNCDGYRTQTPGGWGAPANGNNPGVYRDANFDAAFPDGLTIGCEENSLTLTSAAAVQNYLPCGGPASPLDDSYVDPDCLGNVFTGHLVALTLSVMFDEYDEDFSEAEGNLSEATIAEGPFEGWTVLEIWSLANDVIGGCNTDYSVNQVKNAIAAINENFVDGEENNGFLDCGECGDGIAPEVIYAPSDLELECDDSIPEDEPIFDDEDEELEIIFTAYIESVDCTTYINRTWTATNDCGYSSIVIQVITIIDNAPPVIIDAPEDMTLECSEDIPDSMLSAEDSCSEVTIEMSESTSSTDCPSEYTLTRTWVVSDDCGNSTEHVQVIEVVDTTAPELSGVPMDMQLDCEAELPEPPMVMASDNCDDMVEVMYEEVINDGEETLGCQLLTPVMDDPVWAVIMFSLPDGYGTEYFTVVSGSFIQNEDMTANIEFTVVNTENANGGFHGEVLLVDGMNWDDWSNQDFPTTYKDDLNLAGDNYLDWLYYKIDASSYMEGWGDYEGSYFQITHAPSSYYYGYQVGVAANNVNENFGHGGWMYVTGNFEDASTGFSGDIDVAGDFAFEQSCCDRPSVTRTWTAVDCAGNMTTASQTISFVDMMDEIQPGIMSDLGSLDLSSPMPNPSEGSSLIYVSSTGNDKINVTVRNSMGQLVDNIYRGTITKNQVIPMEINTSDYTSGMYVITVIGSEEKLSTKLLVE